VMRLLLALVVLLAVVPDPCLSSARNGLRALRRHVPAPLPKMHHRPANINPRLAAQPAHLRNFKSGGANFNHAMRRVDVSVKPSAVMYAHRADYSKLTIEKVEDQYYMDGKKMEMYHGHAPVAAGSFLEGTAFWGGILPDIYVDPAAVKIIQKKFRQLGGHQKGDADDAIDVAEETCRQLMPESHPDIVAEFSDTELAGFIKDDGYATLSFFLRGGIGDCRMNALSLAIALGEVAKMGLIRDVEYGNRKWGYLSSSEYPSEEVGQQGEHAITTFRYAHGPKAKNHYVADAYAVPYDRVQVRGDKGVDVADKWYLAHQKRVVGTAHNVYRHLVLDGTYDKMAAAMSAEGQDRFLGQAKVLKSGKAWAYMSETLDHPTIISRREDE